MRLLLIASMAFLIVGCGAAATLPTDGDPSNLSTTLKGAIWHPEFGDQITLSGVDANSILLPPPGAGSTYVNGVMLVDVPDKSPVTLQSQVGFVEVSKDSTPIIFRIYIQEDGQFKTLSEVHISGDVKTDTIEADLTAYRGQNRLIVLSVATENNSPLTTATIWSSPFLRTP